MEDELNNLLLSDFVYPKANLSKRGLQVSIDQNLKDTHVWYSQKYSFVIQ